MNRIPITKVDKDELEQLVETYPASQRRAIAAGVVACCNIMRLVLASRGEMDPQQIETSPNIIRASIKTALNTWTREELEDMTAKFLSWKIQETIIDVFMKREREGGIDGLSKMLEAFDSATEVFIKDKPETNKERKDNEQTGTDS